MRKIRVFRHYVSVSGLLLVMLDFAVSIAVLLAATYIRVGYLPEQTLGVPLGVKAMVFAFVLMLTGTAVGLYNNRPLDGFSGLMIRLALSGVGAAVVLAFLFYIAPSLLVGRDVLATAIGLWIPGVVLVHACCSGVFGRRALSKRILVLGAGERARLLLNAVERKGFAEPRIVGCVPVGGEREEVPDERILRTEETLGEMATRLKVDEIVIGITERRNTLPLDQLLECKTNGVRIIDANTFTERETGKVVLSFLYPDWLLFSDGYAFGQYSRRVERLFDVVAASLLLVVSLPVMLVTAVAIVAEGRGKGPIFYRQERVGLNGKVFNVWKFRSMRVDAEKEGGAQWASDNDPRVTKVGHVIRQLRIDELPQLFNVLHGEMSFVGPRPERPEFVKSLNKSIPYYAERHRVKPGLTGWAQLCFPYGASEKDAEEKLQFDLYYLKNRSTFLDLLILVRTVEVVLFGQGAR